MSSKVRIWKHAVAALAIGLAAPMAATPAMADARSESNEAYLKGFNLYQAGDYRGARIELLKALKANPNNGLARLLQARVALEFGGGVQAQTELERAVQAGVPADKVRHLRAHALILQRKFGDAMDLLDARTIPPQFAAYAARMRGRILTQQNRIADARAEFATALRLGPGDPDTTVDVARFAATDGKPAEAMRLVDTVLAAKPTNGKALLLKGDLVRRTDGLEASLPFFNRALEVDPNNIEALLERAATLGDLNREKDARRDLARLNGLIPDHPLALYLEAVLETRGQRYEKARQLMTRTKGTLNSYTPALMLQGMLAYQANDIGQATDFFGKVVGAAPQSVVARKLYAAAQLRGDDVRGAIETLKPVIDSGAADGRTYALYGAAFARSGNMVKAQEYMQKAVAEAPEASGGLKTQLAMTQLLQGNVDAAEQEVVDVLKADGKSLQALMVLTLIQLRDREYDKAMVTANRIVKLYPDLPVGYNIRGGAELGKGDLKRAEASFRAALARKADYVEARRNLSQVLLVTGRAADAERELKTIIETNKRDVRALMLLANIAGRNSDMTARIEWLQQAAAADPKLLNPRLALADAYLATSQTKRALDESAGILRDFPNDPLALTGAARVYEGAGQGAQVESTLNRLVTTQPANPMARILLARSQAVNKRPAAARATYERALTMAGVDPTPIYAELIAFEARQGDLAAARRWADRLRAHQPREPIADVMMGRALLQKRQPAEALRFFEAGRKVKFTSAVARGIAEANVQLGTPAAGIAVLQSYQRANPRDLEALAAIAELQLNQRQYRAAIANYESIRKLAGEQTGVAVLNNLAWAYSKVGDKRALATAREAYALDASLPAVLDTYGWLLLTTKTDKKQALGLLQRAAAGAPRDADIRFHLAVAQASNGQRAQAVESLRTALNTARFDNRAAAQRLLTRLGG
jgi:putative PEP-CTERM system TPR-repeat lipoprotein